MTSQHYEFLGNAALGLFLLGPIYALLWTIVRGQAEGNTLIREGLAFNERLTRMEARHAIVSADVKRTQLDQNGMAKRLENEFRTIQVELEALADKKERKGNGLSVAVP